MADYSAPPGDSLTPIIDELKELRRRMNEMERPSGTNIGSLVAQVQAALININATVIAATNAYLGTATVGVANLSATGNITAANATTSGQVNAIGSLRSIGAFSTDVSVYPGARQPMWQNNNGMIGYAPSTREKKTDIRPVPFTAANVRACIPRVFAYMTQIDIRDNPCNEFHDPNYEVPDEAGLFAEDLIENGLEAFVIYENDGTTPAGIDYAGFGAVANLVVVRELDERLRALEAGH